MQAAAFDFVRQLRDPVLRGAMKAAGWSSGVTIVVADPGEQVEDVRPRMAAGRNLYVVADESVPCGWHMLLVDRTDGGDTAPDLCDRTWDGHSCYRLGEHVCSCCCGATPQGRGWRGDVRGAPRRSRP